MFRTLLWVVWWVFYGFGLVVTAMTGSPEQLWVFWGVYALGVVWMTWYVVCRNWLYNDGKTLACMIILWPFVVSCWTLGSNWQPRARTQPAPVFPIARAVKWGHGYDPACPVCGETDRCDAGLHG